jgi:hypothetical protein
VSDRCPLCHRPSISDAAYWQGSEPVPPGACPRQGGADCDRHAEERVRLMGRVVEAARPWLAYLDARGPLIVHASDNDRPWISVTTGKGHFAVTWGDVARLQAALRALDGEG